MGKWDPLGKKDIWERLGLGFVRRGKKGGPLTQTILSESCHLVSIPENTP